MPIGRLFNKIFNREQPGEAENVDALSSNIAGAGLGTAAVRLPGQGTVTVETSQPCFACMLGGDDRRTLFTMTAPSSVADVVSTARQGRIECAEVGVAGAGRP